MGKKKRKGGVAPYFTDQRKGGNILLKSCQKELWKKFLLPGKGKGEKSFTIYFFMGKAY